MVVDAFTVISGWPMLSTELSADEFVNSLTKNKVDKACVISSKGIFFDAHSGNETTISICNDFSERLLPIGTIDPRVFIDGELAYCVNNNIKMFALFPETQNWDINSLIGRKLFTEVLKNNLPVMIESSRNSTVTDIYDAVKNASSPIILNEVSLYNLSEAVLLLEQNENIYLSTRLLSGADTIEMLVERFGAKRLMFSSRMPVSSFSAAFLATRYARISQSDLTAILGNNIAEILKIQ